MPDILTVLNRVKDILSQELGDRKVFDKDVAEALGINQLTLATMKNRAKIPYKEILEFCAKRKISINWLLFDQVVESLQAETDKFARVHYFRDIYASAGGGALNEDEEGEMMYLDEEIVQSAFAHPPHVLAVKTCPMGYEKRRWFYCRQLGLHCLMARKRHFLKAQAAREQLRHKELYGHIAA